MRKFLPIILIIALIGGGFSYYWFNIRKPDVDGEIKIWGNVEIRETEIGFRQSGRINQLLVDEGDKVTKGQLLATLDNDTFNSNLANYDANIDLAAANLDKIKTGFRTEEIAGALAIYNQTQAQYDTAKTEYERQNNLLETGAVSQKIVDNAKGQMDSTKAAMEAAKQNYLLKKAGASSGDLKVAKSQLLAAKANKQNAQIALFDTNLYSPVDGIVVSRAKELGSIINPSNVIFTISLNKPIYIRAYAPETALSRFTPGTKVQVKIDSSNKVFEGQIGFVSPKAEFTPKTVETEDLRSDLVYRLRIIVKEDDGKLLQGMPVSVILPALKK